MIIWVAGDRKLTYRDLVREKLGEYAEVGNVLITGAASGVDTMAQSLWGHLYELPYVGMPAPWNRVGRAAGPMRNGVIAVGNALAPHGVLKPDLLLAFPGGRGTQNAKNQADMAGIYVVEVS